MSEQPNDLRVVFLAALERNTPEERARYLDTACRDNPGLRQRVEALLCAHDQAGAFLKQDALGGPLGSVESAIAERPGTVIGRYKLLEQIGEGGFGVVFMAEQLEPIRRKVALKIVKPGMDTKQVIARFEAERQALALMDHPNIAKILDAGVTDDPHPQPLSHPMGEGSPRPAEGSPPLPSDGRGVRGEGPPPVAPRPSSLAVRYGRPYFVMELVHGVPLTQFCDANDLTPSERLPLFLTVCAAVQHAHQKGIIHRDLKPTNILVTLHDGKPVPKVIDFGMAKALQTPLTEKTLFTAYGKLIGTPAYMSPEQAELSGLDLDTRADIYSLGVLLYELLTGTTPFEGERLRAAAFEEMMRIIRQEEPPKPSTRVSTLGERAVEIAKHRQADAALLRRTLQGDLDWIVMKALEKDRARRYETASALAEDLQRHRDHQPVHAGAPSAAYRTRKFVRRHRTGVALAASVTVALVAGLVVSLIGFREARLERDRAQQERDRAVAAEQLAEANERKAQAEAAKSRQVARFLQDMLAGVGPSVARGRDTTMLREILDQTAERVGKDLNNQPEVKAELQYTIAKVYGALSEYDRAEALHREALAIRRKLRGNEDADVAASLFGLGDVIENSFRPTSAEPFYREALAIRRKILGNEHPDVVDSLTGLASTLEGQSKLKEAEMTYHEALATGRKLFGEEHASVAKPLNGLAWTLSKQGRINEGEQLGRQSLALHRKVFGTDHPDLAMSIAALAYMLDDKVNFAEVEALLREGLEMRRKTLGDENDRVHKIRVSLGRRLLDRGEIAEAEACFRRTLAAKAELLKTDDGRVSVGAGILGMAQVLLRQGRTNEAVVFARETVELWRKRLDADQEAAHLLHVLARVLALCGKLEEAEQFAMEALANRRASRGNEHWLIARDLTYLGLLRLQRNKLPEAEEVLREALTLCRETGTELPLVFSPLADVLVRRGKLDEAEACLTEAITERRALYGNEHPQVARALCDLGDVRNRQNRPADAEQLYREAWGIYQKTGFPDPSLAPQFPVVIAHALRQQLKFAEAAALEREAVAQGNVNAVNAVAWRLATCPDAPARDGASAIGFAEKAVAATSRTNAMYLDTLAAACAEAGQFPEAIRVQQEAIALLGSEEEKQDFESRLRLFQAAHPFRDYGDMLRALCRLGKLAEAESLQREQLAMHRVMFEPEAPALAAPLAGLTRTLLDQEKYPEAEQCARECLAIRKKKQSAGWELSEAWCLLGGSLLGQKRYAEAEPLLLAGYEGMKQRAAQIPAEGKPRLQETLQRLVQLYEATDRPAQAAEWKQKLADFEKAQAETKPAAPPK